ncbi:MAG: MBG domain-containing protein [Verrucomicrobia bacterium]|nr:MBG domain-containing protein [Verrucomicrobiota bacterium]
MKTLNLIQPISTNLKHLALAVALASGLGAGSAQAAIGYVATSPSASVTASASLTMDKPAGVAAGHVMIAEIAQYYNGTAADATADGWTLIKGGTITSVQRYGTLLYRVADASDDSVSNYTFTLNPASADLAIGAIMAFSGVDPVTPLDVVGAGFTTVTSGTTVTGAGITTLSPDAAVIMFAMHATTALTLPTWSNWTTATSPGALTEIADYQASATTPGNRGVSIGAAWATKASAGATGNGTATVSASARTAGYLIALLPYDPSGANILTFGLPGNPGVIDGNNITLHLPWGTASTALQNLAPTYTTTRGATCPKASGSIQDFTNPVHYLVTSEDRTTEKDYLVSAVVSTEMIANVQFYTTNNAAPSMTGLQGPVASVNTTTPSWNRILGAQFANVPAGPTALIQADGLASGISLTLSGNGNTRRADGWAPGVGEIPMFSGEAYLDGGTQTLISAFSGLTVGATYDLYAMNSQGSSSDSRFTVNGNTAGAIRLRGNFIANNTYQSTVDWTQFGTTSVDVAGDATITSTASTAYFQDLTPDADGKLTVVMSYANIRINGDAPFIGVAGYQLVQVALPPAATPVITAVGSPLTAVSTTYGTPSAETSFTVSGDNMLGGILVTPPAGFEVSQTSGSGFAGTITVGAVGTIDSTTVYVRLAATAPVAGTYDGQHIVLFSGGAPTVNVTTAESGNTVSPKPLTVTATGPVNKPYGTTLVAGPSPTDFTADATGVGSELVTSVTLTPTGNGVPDTATPGATYVITPSAATGSGGFLASNYDITYTPYDGAVVMGTPTLSVTNEQVIYDGLPHAAEVIGSVDGIVSDVKYNGLSEVPAAAGTYAVTADFVPTDHNYSSLNEAPAGNFVIVQQEIMMVNVQFHETANSSPSMTNKQGPVRSADTTPTWNQFTGNWTFVIPDGGPAALVQADGTASAITLSMAGVRRGGTWGGQGSNGIAVFGGGAYLDQDSGIQTSVFSGLTVGAKYDLYVMNAAGSEGDSRFTVDGNTAGAVRLRGKILGRWPGAWSVDGTTDWTQWVTTTTDAAGDDFASIANTAYFKNLAPTANGKLTIVMSHANSHRADDFSPIAVAGYQLVQVADATGYGIWASANASTGTAADDFDGDGVSNGVEYVLGGTQLTNDLDKLPAVSTTGGDLFFTFLRDHASKTPDTALSIQVGLDLENWPVSYPVPNAVVANNPGVTVEDNGSGFDIITLRIPRDPDAEKFARLQVIVAGP